MAGEMGGLTALPPFSPDKLLNVVVESPSGSPYKYKYEPDLGAFITRAVVPLGTHFPFDFGFIPSTMGQDGDPLDILLFMDAPVFPGCIMPCRLVGVIEAEQTERNGTKEGNDRLIGVAEHSNMYGGITTLEDVPEFMIRQVEEFFSHYNAERGKQFKPLRAMGAERAMELVEAGIAAFRKHQHKS